MATGRRGDAATSEQGVPPTAEGRDAPKLRARGNDDDEGGSEATGVKRSAHHLSPH